MDNDLMRYGDDGRSRLSRYGRDKARVTRQVRGEVRVAGAMADGAIAFAAHAMEAFADLDRHRQQLAGDDPLLNLALGEIEAQALRQVKGIQRGLYNGLG